MTTTPYQMNDPVNHQLVNQLELEVDFRLSKEQSKMKILIIETTFGKITERISDFIPRIGERIDLGYYPAPHVFEIINFPSTDTVKNLNKNEIYNYVDVDVIIFVKS